MRNPFRLLWGNPVVLKELRGRMRGPRAFVVLTGYLSLVGGFTILLYATTIAVSSTTTTQINGGQVGRDLFAGVIAIELFLVTFIAPAFTAGAISGERERQTYDLLRTTLLPEAQLVMGKLFSALGYVFLLLLAAIPLQSLSFILGGTDLPDMFIALLTLFVTAVFLGTMGIYFSARLKRTLPASIATYGLALSVVIGTVVLLGVFVGVTSLILDGNSSLDAQTQHQLEWAVLVGRGVLVCLNPVATLQVTRDYLVSEQNPWQFTYTFSDGTRTQLPSPWLVYAALYLLISMFFFWLTARHLRKIDEF